MVISSSSEDEEGWLRRRRRNARSLDVATSSSREASKAAAWMWHMHGSSPTSKKEGEDNLQSNFSIWESKRRSASCDRKDSRFRQEAASASTSSVSAPALKPVASNPSKVPDPSIWDCGSNLYDTFELVSFSNQLDRSMFVVPALNAPNFHHAVQSPPHHSRFSGMLRTLSLSRTLSLHNSMSVTPPPNEDGNHVEPPDVINASINEANSPSVTNHAPLADLQGTSGPPPPIEPKFSALRRILTTKWSLSRVVKILKKVGKFHKQMQRFRSHGSRDKNVTGRSGDDKDDDDDDGGMSAHRYFGRRHSYDKNVGGRSELMVDDNDDGGMSAHRYFGRRHSYDKNVGGRSELMGDDNDDGGMSEHRYRVYEEKVNEGQGGKHFHHHHHHYHHHFVHHLDQLSQLVAMEHTVCKLLLMNFDGNVADAAEWPPVRAESARLSSDTMLKICADVNWL